MRIGEYEVLGEIARGGMGVVYRGRDPRTLNVVAIKLLAAGAIANDMQRRRFQREIDAMTRLRHKNLVRILSAGEFQGRPYLVMELVEGSALDQLLEQRGPLPTAQAALLIRDVALGLEHSHSLGIIHRDVKPANVVLGPKGAPVLTDFGIVRDLDASASRLTQTGSFLGTPGFWPPEQACGKLTLVGPTSDVYSLGATLYALLTGEPPFTGVSLMDVLSATLKKAPLPPSRIRAGVDAHLEAICLRCLEKEPSKRYTSAASLAQALDGYLEGEPVGVAEEKSRAPVLLAASLLVGLGLALTGWATNEAPPPKTLVAIPAVEPEPEPETETQSARDSARAAIARGDTLLAAGELDQAQASYEAAIAGDPEFALGYVGRAQVHLTRGDFASVEADVNRGLALNPDSPEGLQVRGILRAQLGDLPNSERDFTRALSHDDTLGGAYSGRAAVRLSMGKLREALADAERALETLPPGGPQADVMAGMRARILRSLEAQ